MLATQGPRLPSHLRVGHGSYQGISFRPCSWSIMGATTEEEGETSRERMPARTQLLTVISNRRRAIGEGADQAMVKRLNEAVGETSRNARTAGSCFILHRTRQQRQLRDGL
jgi:hypothetical protein